MVPTPTSISGFKPIGFYGFAICTLSGGECWRAGVFFANFDSSILVARKRERRRWRCVEGVSHGTAEFNYAMPKPEPCEEEGAEQGHRRYDFFYCPL